MHRSEFLAELKSMYPELTQQLNMEQGLLHFEMEVFQRHVQLLIQADDSENLKRCFVFAEKCYLLGNKKLKDAIDVSFVENMVFKGKPCKKWAWNLMPKTLQQLYINFHKTPRFS